HFLFHDLAVAIKRVIRKSCPANGIFRLGFGIVKGAETVECDAAVSVLWGAQAASPQLPAACRQHSIYTRIDLKLPKLSRQAAETCRLAACAPQSKIC